MKIITFYLPQFHEIPENDEFWGKGFTEWVNVKKARPLFEGHMQPKVPLNNNYYNLLDTSVMKWQSECARKYGIYGFCFYHYWIEGRKLLEKPVELFLEEKSININYCLSWANHSWTDSWNNNEKRNLISQTYGGKKDWDNHFNYLLPFFKDERYIKIDNKPLFVIYMPEDIPNLNEMLDYWNEKAIENDFSGICFAYQYIYYDMDKKKDDSRFTYGIEFQPAYAIADSRGKLGATLRKNAYRILSFLQKKLNININLNNKTNFETMEYSKVWQCILNRNPNNSKKIPGAFSMWDNTPRKGKNGLVVTNASPKLFKEYLSQQIVRTREIYKKDMLFFAAWNEWAEGNYLEPDKENGYEYLNAIKEALEENGEFPYATNE